jgi:hypothetical protein
MSVSDSADILALAQRLMRHPHPEGPITTELFVRGLPMDVAPPLALPAGATLLGSSLRRLAGRPAQIEAVLDIGGDPIEVLAAFDRDLDRAVWSPYERPEYMRGGFAPAGFGEARMYRAGVDGPVLIVSVTDFDDGLLDMRLRVDWESFRRMPSSHRIHLLVGDLIPLLRPPRGVALTGEGSSGSDGRWTSEATVATDLPVADLEGHFATQLVDAGWSRAGGNATDTVAWSSWRIPGNETWRGVLTVLAPYSPTERLLGLRLEEVRPYRCAPRRA